MQLLKNSAISCEVISQNIGVHKSADGKELEAGKNYFTAASVMYDAVYVCGGMQSSKTQKTHGDTLHFINEAFKHAKTIAAANEGVDVLLSTSVKDIATAGTETQGNVITELGVVTVRNTTDITDFTREFVKAISQHRHWARKPQKDMVPA